MAANNPWFFQTEMYSFYYPGSFDLSTPLNGSTIVTTKPTFSWSSSDGAATYVFELANDRLFGDIIRTKRDLTDVSYTPATDLQRGKTYYWRVFASNPWGTTVNQGAPWSFTILP